MQKLRLSAVCANHHQRRERRAQTLTGSRDFVHFLNAKVTHEDVAQRLVKANRQPRHVRSVLLEGSFVFVRGHEDDLHFLVRSAFVDGAVKLRSQPTNDALKTSRIPSQPPREINNQRQNLGPWAAGASTNLEQKWQKGATLRVSPVGEVESHALSNQVALRNHISVRVAKTSFGKENEICAQGHPRKPR